MAGSLEVLLSQDAKQWDTVYQHDGTRFLGWPDGNPLVIDLGGQRARYIRIRLRRARLRMLAPKEHKSAFTRVWTRYASIRF